jgi:hypothetical protein
LVSRKSAENASRSIRSFATHGDRMDYIADLVGELKTLSAQANCQTLTALLELAHEEALRRRPRIV